MFIIIEMQTNNGSTAVVTPIKTFDDINKAYQAYYGVLSAAAVSKVERHTAMLITEAGQVVCCECFDHKEVE